MKNNVILTAEVVQGVLEYINNRQLKRSASEQIEYWTWLGQTAETNPDLPIELIKGVFKSIDEVENDHISTFNAEDYK